MTDTLKKKNEAFTAMEALMNTVASEKRSMTTDEVASYTALETQFNALTAQAEREVRFEAQKNTVEKATEKRVIKTDVSVANVDEEKRAAFAEYVKSGDTTELRSLSTYSTSEGGAVVPTTVYNKIQTTLAGSNVFRKIGVNVISTQNPLSFPIVATSGVATWTAESPSGSGYVASDDAFAAVTLNAYKLTRLLKVSEELLNDSAANLEASMAQQIGVAFGAAEELAFISGSGAGQPTGLLQASTVGGVSVGSATVYASSSSLADNMIDAFYTMPIQHRDAGVWIFGDALAKALHKVKSTTNEYLWQPSLTANAPDMFLGRPVYVSSQAPNKLVGVIALFLDPRYYTIGDRVPYSIKRLNERYAELGQIGFVAAKRVDGVLTDATALVKITGA